MASKQGRDTDTIILARLLLAADRAVTIAQLHALTRWPDQRFHDACAQMLAVLTAHELSLHPARTIILDEDDTARLRQMIRADGR